MSKLRDAKIIGTIGAVLMLVAGWVPMGAIIGLVLIFIAIKYISDETKEESIFNNYLLHFIFIILALVAASILIFFAIGGFSFINIVQSVEFTDFSSVWSFFAPYITGILISLIVGWILLIISALYLRKCYNSIATHTKVSLFKTTATIYLIGAVTLIIFIGALFLLIAQIMTIVAFFTLPDNLPKS